jgi:hypothetical protein
MVWISSLGALAMSACDTELFATYTPTARPTRDPTSPPVIGAPTESGAAPTLPGDATEAATDSPPAPTTTQTPTPEGFPPVAGTAPDCAPRWFVAPPPDLCAAEAPLSSFASAQRFEHGLMIWVEAFEQIFVFYGDLSEPAAWDVFPDPYTQGMPRRDPGITPPAGMFQPELGFGAIWRGFYDDQLDTPVRDALGWALEREVRFQTTHQCSIRTHESVCFLKRADGEVIVLTVDQAALWPLDLAGRD